MISLLRGTIVYHQGPYVILDVSGVGYKVYVSNATLSRLPIDAVATLFTYLQVRDDALDLYGFFEASDLKLFEYLIAVSGVGCKTAMGIFSIAKREEILQAIISGDVSFFLTVPRLGKKNAQKIIIELKSKLGGDSDFDLGDGLRGNETVMAALQQFGYSSGEIHKALQSLGTEELNESEKVRRALKYLGSTK